jgi:hypothetical protein
MSNFQSSTTIKRTRNRHTCQHCGRLIEIGAAASKTAGIYEGDFYSDYSHVECADAAHDYATMHDAWGDDYVWLHDMSEQEDFKWLLENHPIVAERLNVAKWIEM